MKSVLTGSLGVVAGSMMQKAVHYNHPAVPWDSPQLQFAVREPFPSRASSTNLVYGCIEANQPLHLTSLMPENGVIFSDGIEADFLAFNAGVKAVIGLAEKRGRLVV